MTKYDMAVIMAGAMNLPTNHIESDKTPSTGAPRPFDSHLQCTRIEQLGVGKRTTLAENIKQILTSFS